MLGHQPKIKKLSTAIKHGKKMAEERGIKQTTGSLFRTNLKGEVCQACALGMAVIGKFGVEYANSLNGLFQEGYESLHETLKTDKPNTCLNKAVAVEDDRSIEEVIFRLNDGRRETVENIVATLESCKL